MTFGIKTGGRTRGTPNRRTQDVQALLARIGCDPIEGMASIAMDRQNPVEIRARMYAELAQYIAPKRKAIQVDGGEKSRVTFNLGIGIAQDPLQCLVADGPLVIEARSPPLSP